MDFKELEQKILDNAKRYEQNHQVKVDLDFSLLKLIEEVGELYQAIMIHQKKSRPEKHLPEQESHNQLAEELSDVVGMAIVLADRLGVDVEKALLDKWINHSESDGVVV